MKPLVSQKVSAGFGLALIILVANILVSYHNTLQLIGINNSVTHTLEVLEEIESVLANFLQKPFTPDALERKAREVLEMAN